MIKYKRNVIALIRVVGGNTLAIYSNMKALKKGVAYWMKKYPDVSLCWHEYALNYNPEPLTWGYAYISLSDESEVWRIANGSTVPKEVGVNLIKG